MITSELRDKLTKFYHSGKKIAVLTGAGVSAESGIPTFRGPEGYWKIGSENYTPQTIGTYRMYRQNPKEVWKWYLFRHTVCQKSQPNPGHYAIVEMEKIFGDRFTLITQNVDGLHLRAGNSFDRTFLIHGSLEYMRCGEECTRDLYPFPTEISPKTRDSDLPDHELKILTCPKCGSLTRPHVLWFDEYYDEEYYKYESSLYVAAEADLLITVGTSGATNLPNHVLGIALQKGSLVIDVNIVENSFSKQAEQSGNGYFLQGPSGEVLPEMVELWRSLE